MKLKIIYIIMSISLLTNLVLFDTLGKTVADVHMLQDKVKVQEDLGIELLAKNIELEYNNRLLQDLGK